MIRAEAAKEITIESRLDEKNINLCDVDSHLEYLIKNAAENGKNELKLTQDQMKNCEGLFHCCHDRILRNVLRERYESIGYQVRFNRDNRYKLSDLTLNWG
ncbi:hypothetical protein BCPG3_147 [Bacillus phage BCPG3]|uniref:Uncharacterized protein n=1 Tax=Bacillus phage BPS10C TaxID=1277886 RepID=W5QUC6_9CAUD|nr:hypothetical protein BPS10C_163 [Bacillus phage BPS10C]AGI12160.1 hypothetical protein BPS10C_163 [Bacillus phage BPS10C]QQO38845.1 hypothetical protein BCPG1_114 [Bacillus phage BCPG1]QSJ04464.1 hypothetical protein BCPG3_147 [Bacillus phage BCPG3]QSJ04673.1 hypothetical protein BCP18_141 [Bacillus phage BCP18]